jgi:NCS2 family nucleobase:cation symporter-2
MRKPDNITYWLEDKPPLQIALILAIQQMSFLAVYLVVSPLFARTLQLTHEQSLQLISSTLLASAAGVLLQTLRRWGVGSGFFCPLQATSSTFGALTMAKMIGGIEAMFGAMTVIGVSQMAFGYIFSRMRSIFSIQIAGISVMLIGLGLGHNGLKLILEPRPGQEPTSADAIICLLTLGTMVACNVWSSGYLRLFSAFIGLAVGIGASLMLETIPAEEWTLFNETPLFFIPHPMHIGWSLDWHSTIPVVVTGLFLALHGFGAIIAAQRFNDADWKRPDMTLVRQGVVAEGLTNIVTSALNGVPITSSGGAVSLAAATGCTSRYIAYWLAGIMVVLAFMPKAILFWEMLPESVMGSAMIFLACFTTMAGLQIVASRLLDNRKILTIGIGLLLGISYEPLRDRILRFTPDALEPLLFSGVALGVVGAVMLSTVFRLGDHTKRRRTFDALHSSINEVAEFLERQGKSWGARSDVVRRAEYATWQAFEILTEHELVETGENATSTVEMETIFTEFSFMVILRYRGISVPLAMHPPTHEELLQSDHAVLQMAGYMLRRLADRVDIHVNHMSECEMRLVFND